jgi:4-deoxy-L-threo-5-hexosulose-uronate ketol-isomerase
MDGTGFRPAETRLKEVRVRTRHATHPDEYLALAPDLLRQRFLVEDLFAAGEVRLAYSHHDRVVIGGAVPGGNALPLPAPDQLRAGSFTDRRELAVVCLAGTGTVTVAGTRYPMSGHDVLYVGRGAGPVELDGADARYYLVSAPAHSDHKTTLVRRDEVHATRLGDRAHANERTIRRYVHADGVASDQLVLGITELHEGSVWNTMPCHTHERRTEVYLYFGLAPGERVVHLCGRPDATRSLVVAAEQAVISPPWSVHTGCGTANYAFVWAMAGENIAYDDMDQVPVEELR